MIDHSHNDRRLDGSEIPEISLDIKKKFIWKREESIV